MLDLCCDKLRRLLAMVVLTVFVPGTAFAVIDSLDYCQQQLKRLPKGEVSFHFMKMAQLAGSKEQKKAFYYSAMDAAKEYGNVDTICLRLVQIAWMAYGDGDYALTNHFIGQGVGGEFCKLTPSAQGEVLYCQGMCACRTGDSRLALSLLREAVPLLVETKHSARAVSALYDIADVCLIQSNNHYAIESLKEALVLAMGHHLEEWQAQICNRLSVVFDDLQQYDEALRYSAMAFDVASGNERTVRFSSFVRMGDLYLKMNTPDGARRLYEKALAMGSDSLLVYDVQIKLAHAAMVQGKHEQALSNARKCLSVAVAMNNMPLKAASLELLGAIEHERHQYHSAISYFEQSLEVAEPLQDHRLKASVLNRLGNSCMAAGDWTKAQSLFEQGVSVCYNHRLKYELANLYLAMSKLFRQQKDYEKALDLQCSYATLRDSLFADGILERMAQMEMKIHAMTQMDYLQELRHENAFIARSMAQEKNKQTIFMIIAVVLFFISVVAIRLGYANYRRGLALKKKNKELADLNATKDKFFSIIAHDLKAPFNSLLGFSELLTLHAENKSNKEVVEYSELVYGAARRLYHLVENLLQWSRAQVGTVSYKPERLHIATQTANVVSLLKMNAESKDIVLTHRIDPDIVAYADANHYNTILRNLLSNAIKFSQVGSVVSIGARTEQNRVTVWVSDTGVGMHQEQQKDLFSINRGPCESGTLNEKGSGLGLLICKEFVELNKGEIWVESQWGRGSVFNFTLPLHLN